MSCKLPKGWALVLKVCAHVEMREEEAIVLSKLLYQLYRRNVGGECGYRTWYNTSENEYGEYWIVWRMVDWTL